MRLPGLIAKSTWEMTVYYAPGFELPGRPKQVTSTLELSGRQVAAIVDSACPPDQVVSVERGDKQQVTRIEATKAGGRRVYHRLP